MRFTTITASLATLALAISTMSACSRTIVEGTVDTGYDSGDIVQSVDFWHALPGRSAVSNDEGLHGLILFADDEDPNTTYDDRVDYLKAMGWIAEDFNEPSNMAMRRGTLAKGLTHALDIEGGVMMRLTKKSSRYSVRELVYLGIMPQGTEYQVLNGYEYLGVISKAQDYELLNQGEKIEQVPPSSEELDAPVQDAPEAEQDAGADGD